MLKHDTAYFIRACKNKMILKAFKRCPCCKSKNIHFVEGGHILEKWFCKDCLALHYKLHCPSCNKPMWFFMAYKPHIMKQYQLGKYKNKKTFRKSLTEEYIQQNISFHSEAYNHWSKIKKEFLMDKKKKMNYGGSLK